MYVSDAQINLIAPLDLIPGSATVTVQSGGGRSASIKVKVTPVAPGIFSDPQTNFATISLGGASTIAQLQSAARGSVIGILCTGLGAVRSDGTTVAQPQVVIAGFQATVLASALAPASAGGTYQVNVRIPQNVPVGTQNLVLTIGGVSSNSVRLAIQ